jgi:hypothetical protein
LRAPYLDPRFVRSMGGLEKVQPVLDDLDAEKAALQAELAGAVGPGEIAAEADIQEVLEHWTSRSVADKRRVISRGLEAVMVSRRPAGGRVPVGGRVVLHWRGEGTAPARPSPGRPELEAGVLGS